MEDLKEIYEKTIQEGKPFILTEEMLNAGIKNIDKPIKSIEDLVMVHKTNFFPYGAVKTPYETGLSSQRTYECVIDGKEKKFCIPYRVYRNTAHFCLNGAVESHAYGSWDGAKYAVLMPLAKNKDKIVAGTECDLFSFGSVPITDNAYILCQKDEVNTMRNANPSAHIIGFEGNSVDPYVNVFLSNILNYKYKMPTENSRYWDSGYGKEFENVCRIIQENGWEYTIHTGTKWDKDDYTKRFTELLCNWLKIIINEKLLYSLSNKDEVKNVIIKILNGGNLLNGFNFADKFKDEERFKYISDAVMDNTGIDLSIFRGTDILKGFAFGNDSKSILADYIIDILRIRALKEKSQLEYMTEEEKYELQYYEEFGTYVKFSDEERSKLKKLEEMRPKHISELSGDDLNFLMEITNYKIQHLNKSFKENNYKLNIKYLEGATQEKALEFAKVGIYTKPIKAGMYLTVQLPDSLKVFSQLSGVDIQKLYDKFNSAKSDEELYYLDEQIANIPNCHLLQFSDVSITDCNLTDCKTVDDFETVAINYSRSFSKMLSGQNIEFDTNGYILPSKKNPEKTEFQELNKQQKINSLRKELQEVKQILLMEEQKRVSQENLFEDEISKISK